MSTTRFGATLATATALVLAAALPTMAASAESAVKYMDVNNARLPYVEEGSGAPVVFVHGLLFDHRIWTPHVSALGKEGYRAVSYTQRYFGTETWQDSGPPFSGKTHAEDLAGFIRGLGAGPVHVVAHSYGGQLAFVVALNNPELVKSVFIYEPAAPTYVNDPSVLKAIVEDRTTSLAPAVKAFKEGNNDEAARQAVSAASGRGGEYFATQRAEVQRIELDNAPTVPKMFSAPPPVAISCEQLGSIKIPMAIVWGSSSRPFYRLIAEEAARCTPAATHLTIPDAIHQWPVEQPAKFAQTLVQFLKSQ